MTAARYLLIAAWLGADPAAGGLAPVSHYHDLVAGTGVAGFENGEFHRASFNGPAGLAVLEKRALLAVSDRGNNRIRAVWLNENNRVETLAGSGVKGSADGPLEKASFNGPGSLVAVSDHSLIVDDSGNHVFRLIDLAKGSVETIAGEAGAVPRGDVWSLVHAPAENAIYFTEPELHAVQRLDLASRTVKTLVKDDSRIPRPAALCFFQGKLYVADRDGQVWRITSLAATGAPTSVTLEAAWKGERILALTASEDRLFALQASPAPAWTCLSGGGEVLVTTASGDKPYTPYLRFEADERVAFVPDERAGRSFFLTSSSLNSVLCLKEYRFGELWEADSATGPLVDFEYPARKPERTFRILMLGDSSLSGFDILPRESARRPGKMATIPKRLELMLNTLASLEGGGVHYEVLSMRHVSWDPLLVWPNYGIADFVGKFDVDLVLLMLSPATTMPSWEAYLQRPITSKGIPAATTDAEYLLQPMSKRLVGNPAARFMERCKALGFARPEAEGSVDIVNCGVLRDAPARSELLSLFAPPLRGIRESLESARPGGKSPAFWVCYFALGQRGAGVAERSFWEELCQRLQIPWLDLVAPLVAVADTWYPMWDQPGVWHFNENGHMVFAFVLAHELVGRGIIPFARPKASGWALPAALALLGVAGAVAAARSMRRWSGKG